MESNKFFDKIIFTDYCWLWSGATNDKGYGFLNVDGRCVKAHRFSWEIFKGPIPDGLNVLHKCDVRNCVNTNHLFLGTQQDNMKDMVKKNRQRKGENVVGSKLTKYKVIQIRKQYVRGKITFRKLAIKYDVSPAQIYNVVRNISWKEANGTN